MQRSQPGKASFVIEKLQSSCLHHLSHPNRWLHTGHPLLVPIHLSTCE